MKRLLLIALLGAASICVRANLIEGFEHNNAGLYNQVSGNYNNLSLTGGAAHDGNFGAQFAHGQNINQVPSWLYRSDATTSAGTIISSFVRFSSTSIGETFSGAFVGVGATGLGTWSMAALPNSGMIALVESGTYNDFDIRAASAFAGWAVNTWYRVELDWQANGNMSVSLWNEGRTSLLAQTGIFSTGNVTSGGLALRGFDVGSGNGSVQIDTIAATPEPATMAAVLIGAGALIRRRRTG